MRYRVTSVAVILAALTLHPLLAQPHIRVPQASPRAVVEETFGITDISVSYHRPSVNGRRVWGGLVPENVIWRAGANENTTISFSTPVTVEGSILPAGTYSLFMIPQQPQWTVIFNRFTGGWGTYSYDPAEDVLRIKVTPEAGPHQERLAYTFDESKHDGVTIALRWETLRIPIRISAETAKLTSASIRNELRSSLHWVPQAWSEAANYEFRNGNLEAALEYANGALRYGDDGMALRAKARIVEKMGDAKQAADLRARAAALSPEQAALGLAYAAIGAKKYDEAVSILERQMAANPKGFRAWTAMALVHSERGERDKAQTAFAKAAALATTQSERVEVQDAINELAARK